MESDALSVGGKRNFQPILSANECNCAFGCLCLMCAIQCPGEESASRAERRRARRMRGGSETRVWPRWSLRGWLGSALEDRRPCVGQPCSNLFRGPSQPAPTWWVCLPRAQGSAPFWIVWGAISALKKGVDLIWDNHSALASLAGGGGEGKGATRKCWGDVRGGQKTKFQKKTHFGPH